MERYFRAVVDGTCSHPEARAPGKAESRAAHAARGGGFFVIVSMYARPPALA
jgi:hypothetical protein